MTLLEKNALQCLWQNLIISDSFAKAVYGSTKNTESIGITECNERMNDFEDISVLQLISLLTGGYESLQGVKLFAALLKALMVA